MGFKRRGPKKIKFYHDDVHGYEGQPGDVTEEYLLTQHDGIGVVLAVPASPGETYCMIIACKDGRTWRIVTGEFAQEWINLRPRHMEEMARNLQYVVKLQSAQQQSDDDKSRGCDLCSLPYRWVHPEGRRRCEYCNCSK